MFAAEACNDLAPLRLRSQRYVKTLCDGIEENLTSDRACTMGVQLKYGSCKCTVHQPLEKLSLHEPNDHTLHNLMRVNRAMYHEVEAAMHRLVPVLVFLKVSTDGEEYCGDINPHKLKATSKILISLRPTRRIILQNALPIVNENDEQGTISEIFTFFDWWYARSKTQAQLRVRLGELTHPYFDALEKLDYWLSEQPRDLGNMRFVFDGYEDSEESIRTCVVKLEYLDGFGREILAGPSLNDGSMVSVRRFCRQHPDLIEGGTIGLKFRRRRKMTTGTKRS